MNVEGIMVDKDRHIKNKDDKGKDDRSDCANYRGINILSIPGKIYGRVLISRVIENKKEQVTEGQRGFR